MTPEQQLKIEQHLGRKLTDLDLDRIEVFKKGLTGLFEILGEDQYRDGLKETPNRYIDSLFEKTKGYSEDPIQYLKTDFDISYQDIVLVRDIRVFSVCEHHLTDMEFSISIAYIPYDKVVGLSQLARLAEGLSKRLQVQERLTNEILKSIESALEPLGAFVYIQGKHNCMCARGVHQKDSTTITISATGAFKNPAKRQEALTLLKN